ncbi:hypothetical protein [Siminovitchia fortis]|uniref:hypothetical protein n=1 Tax=Siminovitchia fortis TaxID=254758 RepID=UPI001642FCA1|nr:hypothetical protein [Siminovitchia fortis]
MENRFPFWRAKAVKNILTHQATEKNMPAKEDTLKNSHNKSHPPSLIPVDGFFIKI